MNDEIPPVLQDALNEVFFWQYENTDSFKNILFFMFQKADRENFKRLRLGFPFEAQAYTMWYQSESQNKFFKKYTPELYETKFGKENSS